MAALVCRLNCSNVTPTAKPRCECVSEWTECVRATYRGVAGVVLVAQVHVSHGDLHAIHHRGQQAQQNALGVLTGRGLGLHLGRFEQLGAHQLRLFLQPRALLLLLRALLRRVSGGAGQIRLTFSATAAGLASR